MIQYEYNVTTQRLLVRNMGTKVGLISLSMSCPDAVSLTILHEIKSFTVTFDRSDDERLALHAASICKHYLEYDVPVKSYVI